MLTFIIPVKSAQVSGSWGQFSKLFERTLKSVTSQTSPNYRVVVVCHEKPETDFNHPKIEYIHVDFPVPDLKTTPKETHNGLKEQDKSMKILKGVEYVKKYDSDYLMVVDSDDCISNRIVAYVDENLKKDLVGWYFSAGYFYREGDKFISLNRNGFNTLCGTCIIIKPDYIKHIFREEPVLEYIHGTTKFPDNSSLTKLPFPGAAYSLANGENHYMQMDQIKKLNKRASIFSLATLKSIIRKLKKYRVKVLSSKLIEEFGLYNVNLK